VWNSETRSRSEESRNREPKANIVYTKYNRAADFSQLSQLIKSLLESSLISGLVSKTTPFRYDSGWLSCAKTRIVEEQLDKLEALDAFGKVRAGQFLA